MKNILCIAALLPLWSGFTIAQDRSAPIYQVTVIERNVDAVNYDRSLPTALDFRGTVLLPMSKGSAWVQSKRGRTEIDARFEKLAAPQRFGQEYLTYVLWAITPEGRPHNLGEMIPNSSDKAHLSVTTDLQAFGLIVTAEPYSAVRQPGDVVVLENKVRPDTMGLVKPIRANYALLPRGHYVWDGANRAKDPTANSPSVSMEHYETLVQLYEAQNAVGIARQAGAETYAPQVFANAMRLMIEAEKFANDKGMRKRSIQSAREAVQTAEDARLIAERARNDEQLAATRAQATQAEQAKALALQAAEQARLANEAAQQAKISAETEMARVKAQAAAERTRAESERAARLQMEQEVIRANAALEARRQQSQLTAEKTALRRRLLDDLNRTIATMDTPKGLVITVSDNAFQGEFLRPQIAEQVARAALAVASQRGLTLEVEAHSDRSSGQFIADRRAQAVRRALRAGAIPETAIVVRGYGESVPLVANTTLQAREKNRRIEIVIFGDPIGNHALWDQSYSLSFRGR